MNAPGFCDAPDRHEPRIKCGYPMPCPHHTVLAVVFPRDAYDVLHKCDPALQNLLKTMLRDGARGLLRFVKLYDVQPWKNTILVSIRAYRWRDGYMPYMIRVGPSKLIEALADPVVLRAELCRRYRFGRTR